jgi:hypothetical protein
VMLVHEPDELGAILEGTVHALAMERYTRDRVKNRSKNGMQRGRYAMGNGMAEAALFLTWAMEERDDYNRAWKTCFSEGCTPGTVEQK